MQLPLLIDLDGVLRIGENPAKNIQTFFTYLKQENIQACILSNSSLFSSNQIIEYFDEHSIQVEVPIITAIDAAYDYIYNRYKKVAVYTSQNVKKLFEDFLDYNNPEAVLVGDIGNKWNYELMQTIFEFVKNGAELIAAHKNKFWYKPNLGIQLDAGPFIHAIEYAASTKATLIGKPSSLYFHSALQKIKYKPKQNFIMLGDDLESDIKGAKQIGAKTILILTGKTKSDYASGYKKYIDYEANNLIEVLNILEKLKREKNE